MRNKRNKKIRAKTKGTQLSFLKQKLSPSASSDELGIARASINIGIAQLALKKFDEALECQLKALKITEKLEDAEMRGNALGNLGGCVESIHIILLY